VHAPSQRRAPATIWQTDEARVWHARGGGRGPKAPSPPGAASSRWNGSPQRAGPRSPRSIFLRV